jgi:hypothetical protein
MTLFSKWWAQDAPTEAKLKCDIFGRILPFNPELESVSARFNVWRRNPNENDRQLARRAALAICESLERQAQVTAELERDLDLVLAYDKR